MPLLNEQHIGFIKTLFPFNLIDQLLFQRVVQLFESERLPAGAPIYQKNDLVDCFYLILSGSVVNTGGEKKLRENEYLLGPGEYFGEEALRVSGFRNSSATCKTQTELLKISHADISGLREENPLLRRAFNLVYQTFKIRTHTQIPWLGKEEKLTLITRRHPFFLFLRIFFITGGGLVGSGLLLSSAITSRGFSIWSFIGALLVFVLGVLLGAWAALEWTNDYFFITQERVLVQKKLIGFFESRQESPLSAILSTGLDTSFWGRAIGFGALTLRSYTGNLRFKRLPAPQLIFEVLENQRLRVEKETRHTDQDDIRELLEVRLGGGPGKTVQHAKSAPKSLPITMYQGGSILDAAAQFFGLRSVKNNAIIYRTHWWILVCKTFLPGLILAAVIFSVLAKIFGLLPDVSESLVYGLAIAVTILSFGWWLYQYADWHNDIYVIMPDQLLDIYRKPLGTEERRSAPIKNIQTVEFLRKGIIGLVLNYGTVRIQIGNEELTFDNVYDPGAIQTEIFAYFKHHTEKSKQADQAKLADWILTYDEIKKQEQRQTPPGGTIKNR